MIKVTGTQYKALRVALHSGQGHLGNPIDLGYFTLRGIYRSTLDGLVGRGLMEPVKVGGYDNVNQYRLTEAGIERAKVSQ